VTHDGNKEASTADEDSGVFEARGEAIASVPSEGNDALRKDAMWFIA